MNIVILQGNLVEEIKTYTSKDGIEIVKGVIACGRKTKKKESDFINFTVMGYAVDYVKKYAKKGSKVLIQGTWNHSGFKDKDGNYKVYDTCFVEDITIFGGIFREKVETTENAKTPDIADDDLPF